MLLAALISGLLIAAGEMAPPTAPPPRASGADTVLLVVGDVPHALALSTAEFAALPRAGVTPAGSKEEYQGVLLMQILSRAGIPMGEEMHGGNVYAYVVATAADKYEVLYSVPEVDTAFGGRPVLVADRKDGRPLAPVEGPLRIISPGDREHARWLKGVRVLTVHRRVQD